MTKEHLKEKVMEQHMTKEEFEKLVDIAIEHKAFDYEKLEDNFLPAYAIAVGIYNQHIHGMANGSLYSHKNQWVKRMAKKVIECVTWYRTKF